KRRPPYNSWNNLLFINDDKRFITLPKSLDLIPKEPIIMVRNILSKEDLTKVSILLLISPVKVCNSPPLDEPSIAVVTSSYFYDNINECTPSILDIAYITSENKRLYAKKHGYAFIPRSLEFQSQNSVNIWGKIDAVKKALPYYDWILWIDNDAIITNQEVSIQELFNRFYRFIIKGNNKIVRNKKLDKRDHSLEDRED
ncbi:2903_t:CDS:1, partial [Scutellospora calospora]